MSCAGQVKGMGGEPLQRAKDWHHSVERMTEDCFAISFSILGRYISVLYISRGMVSGKERGIRLTVWAMDKDSDCGGARLRWNNRWG